MIMSGMLQGNSQVERLDTVIASVETILSIQNQSVRIQLFWYCK